MTHAAGNSFDSAAEEVKRAFRPEFDRARKQSRADGGEQERPIAPYVLRGPEDFARIRRPQFIVPGLIIENGVFLLYAPSGAYKTTTMLLIMLLAANGLALDGSAISAVPLVIVANEDTHGVELRLRALAEQRGLSLANVRVLASSEFRLDNEHERDRLVVTVKHAFPGKRPMVLFDHYDVMVTEKPTDPEMGARARDGLRDLIRRAFSCAVLLAHTPWGTEDRAKLPVSLWATMDGRASLKKKPDGTADLHVDHVKNGESGFALTVRAVKVEIQLEDGPFTTIAAEIVTDPETGQPLYVTPKERKGRDLSDDQRTALKAIQRAIIERPATPPPKQGLPTHAAVTMEQAATELIAELLPTTTRTGQQRPPNKQREQAGRVLKQLHGKHLALIVDGFVWLPRRALEEAAP
jgi:hypothetical protein